MFSFSQKILGIGKLLPFQFSFGGAISTLARPKRGFNWSPCLSSLWCLVSSWRGFGVVSAYAEYSQHFLEEIRCIVYRFHKGFEVTEKGVTPAGGAQSVS